MRTEAGGVPVPKGRVRSAATERWFGDDEESFAQLYRAQSGGTISERVRAIQHEFSGRSHKTLMESLRTKFPGIFCQRPGGAAQADVADLSVEVIDDEDEGN